MVLFWGLVAAAGVSAVQAWLNSRNQSQANQANAEVAEIGLQGTLAGLNLQKEMYLQGRTDQMPHLASDYADLQFRDEARNVLSGMMGFQGANPIPLPEANLSSLNVGGAGGGGDGRGPVGVGPGTSQRGAPGADLLDDIVAAKGAGPAAIRGHGYTADRERAAEYVRAQEEQAAAGGTGRIVEDDAGVRWVSDDSFEAEIEAGAQEVGTQTGGRKAVPRDQVVEA